MTLNFCILASGSNGNCSAIWSEKTAILVDCGCSRRYIIKNLVKLGVSLSNLTAAIITHAHTEHISGSGLSFFVQKQGSYLHA